MYVSPSNLGGHEILKQYGQHGDNLCKHANTILKQKKTVNFKSTDSLAEFDSSDAEKDVRYCEKMQNHFYTFHTTG